MAAAPHTLFVGNHPGDSGGGAHVPASAAGISALPSTYRLDTAAAASAPSAPSAWNQSGGAGSPQAQTARRQWDNGGHPTHGHFSLMDVRGTSAAARFEEDKHGHVHDLRQRAGTSYSVRAAHERRATPRENTHLRLTPVEGEARLGTGDTSAALPRVQTSESPRSRLQTAERVLRPSTGPDERKAVVRVTKPRGVPVNVTDMLVNLGDDIIGLDASGRAAAGSPELASQGSSFTFLGVNTTAVTDHVADQFAPTKTRVAIKLDASRKCLQQLEYAEERERRRERAKYGEKYKSPYATKTGDDASAVSADATARSSSQVTSRASTTQQRTYKVVRTPLPNFAKDYVSPYARENFKQSRRGVNQPPPPRTAGPTVSSEYRHDVADANMQATMMHTPPKTAMPRGGTASTTTKMAGTATMVLPRTPGGMRTNEGDLHPAWKPTFASGSMPRTMVLPTVFDERAVAAIKGGGGGVRASATIKELSRSPVRSRGRLRGSSTTGVGRGMVAGYKNTQRHDAHSFIEVRSPFAKETEGVQSRAYSELARFARRKQEDERLPLPPVFVVVRP
ncbi:hypothetical protein NFJ02_27g64380 [Pycnococcus provasolii]